MLASLWGDLRYAIRALSRTPSFTSVAMLTLALGIGVNVALFSMFQQILLRPLPVNEPERLVNLTDPGPDPNRRMSRASLAGEDDTIFSYPMFRDLERSQEALAGIAAHRIFDASVSTGEQPRRETGVFVSGSYFSVLGVQPTLGRLLGPQDDQVDGQAESVVLSHAYWQNQFGGDPGVLGRTLIVNGTPLVIIGVAPSEFHGTTIGARASVFVPITARGAVGAGGLPNHEDRGVHWVHIFGRLNSGVTREEAASSIEPLYRSIINEIEVPFLTNAEERELAAFRTKLLALAPGARGQSLLLPPARDRLEMLLVMSAAVLLLCCANVAGLLLVRGSARSGEMAVRTSMGATPGRVVSLLFAESLALALPAALLSLPVAWWTLRVIANAVPKIPTDAGLVAPSAAFDVSLSAGAALVAICAAVISALAFGIFPARELMRTDPAKTLQAYGTRQTSAKGVTRFRTALATAQVALSMALLAISGVFAQSLGNIASIDLGLDVESVVMFSTSPQASGYAPDATARLFDQLEQQLASIPGVTSVGSATFGLLGGGTFRARGVAVDGAEVEEEVTLNFVSPGYFQTLGIELLAGREFGEADGTGAPGVVIVNQRFAERLALDRDIVGRTLSEGGTGTIVGLVANAKAGNVTDEIGAQMFLLRRQSPMASAFGSATFYLRGARPPEDLMNEIRTTASRVDPLVPITNLRTMEQQVNENLATERFVAGASAAFAVLATLLAGLGLYGVLAYSVAQRSRELALRVALGATASRIRKTVFEQVALVASAGIVLGVITALGLGHLARSLLFGVENGDPVVFVGAAGLLGIVVLGATYIATRRASRIDPIAALRSE